MCQPDQNIQTYTLHLAPFDGYATPNPFAGYLSLSNMSCIITPIITTVNVTYASTTRQIEIVSVTYIESSSMTVPNETAGVVDDIFSVAETYRGNPVVDSMFNIRMTNPSLSFTQILQNTISGMIEIQGTNLRLYYAAEEAPGRAIVSGEYVMKRIGYDGRPLGLLTVLPPLAIILVMASVCIVMGVGTGIRFVHGFEPTNSVSLITASAPGGRAGNLKLSNEQGSRIDKEVLQVKLRFSSKEGLFQAQGR